MTRTAFVAACLAASAAAFSPEFLQGCETGIFLGDESQFSDYSCPMPTIAPQAKMYLDMLLPMKGMIEGMNQGKKVPAFEAVTEVTKQIGTLYSLFYADYDSGDFCKGLIFSKEMATIFLTFGRNIFSGMFGEHTSAVQDMLSQNWLHSTNFITLHRKLLLNNFLLFLC